MKKIITLLTVTTISTQMLTGCSLLTPTVESLLTECEKNMLEVTTMDIEQEMGFGITMSQDENEFGVTFDGKLDMLYERVDEEDYKAKADLDMEMSMTGGMSEKTSSEMYFVAEGDTITTYTKDDDSNEWSKTEEKKEDQEASFLLDFSLEELADKFELEKETEKEDGKECYVLKGDIETDKFGSVLGSLGMDDEMTYHTVLKIDKKNKTLVSLKMTADEDMFKQALEEGEFADFEGVSFDVEELIIEMKINEINRDEKVEIPSEVLENSKEVDEEETDFSLDRNKDTYLGDEDDIEDLNEADDMKDETEDEEANDTNQAEMNVSKKSVSVDFDFEDAGFACEESFSADGNQLFLTITNT